MKQTCVHKIWLLPLFLLLTGSVVAQQTDVVELKDGTSSSGSIQGFTVKYYVFQSDQGTNQIPHQRVRNIRYWDVTKPLGRLEQAFQNRRYQRVINFGEEVRNQLKNDKLRSIHRPRVLYFLASAHFRVGNLGRAVEVAKEGLAEPGHIWFDHLVRIRLLGETYRLYDPEQDVTDETYDNISSLGQELISISEEDTEAPQRTVDFIRLLRLQALEELGEGKLPITRVRYENLKGLSDPVLEHRRFLGQRRCFIRQRKELDRVVTEMENRLQKNKNSVLLQSGKELAAGMAQFQKWRDQKTDSSLVHGAISSLVRAYVVHDASTERYTIQHRQSLFQTLVLYHEIATSASDEAKTNYFSRQVQQTHDELTSRYPGSPEAQKADVMIQN